MCLSEPLSRDIDGGRSHAGLKGKSTSGRGNRKATPWVGVGSAPLGNVLGPVQLWQMGGSALREATMV